MSQHKHIHPAPVSAGRQIATALALAGLASFSLPAIAADYVGINDLGASRDNQDGSGASGSYATSIGTWTKASGLASTAVGSRANAGAESAVAIGASADATGSAAIALGEESAASANADTAIGRKSKATGGQSTAIGSGAAASGNLSSAIGAGSTASGIRSLASGSGASATAGSATAIGTEAQATATSATGVGAKAQATAISSSAYGYNSTASATYATALGNKATASGTASTAVGSEANAGGKYSSAFGEYSNAAGDASVAIGAQSSAASNQSVAIGRNAKATDENSVALGANSATAAAVGTSSATVNGITYGGFAGAAPVGTVSVGDTGAERTITNVAAGRITSTSTDAINGSQLYQVASQANGNSTQINNINNRIDDMDKDLRAGIAGATAIAFLQRPNEAGKSMVSAAVGGYRGEQALALGYATNSDNNKWSTKVGLGVDTQKNINWGGSVGYQW